MKDMLEFHSSETKRLEKLFNKISKIYSVTHVLSRELISFSEDQKTIDAFIEIQDKEYKNKIEFDCCLLVYKASSERLINLLQVFNDIVKADLPIDHYNKLVADTLLVTKKHAQTES